MSTNPTTSFYCISDRVFVFFSRLNHTDSANRRKSPFVCMLLSSHIGYQHYHNQIPLSPIIVPDVDGMLIADSVLIVEFYPVLRLKCCKMVSGQQMRPLSVVFREGRNGISWLSAEAMIPKRAVCRVDYPQDYFVQNTRKRNSFCLN